MLGKRGGELVPVHRADRRAASASSTSALPGSEEPGSETLEPSSNQTSTCVFARAAAPHERNGARGGREQQGGPTLPHRPAGRACSRGRGAPAPASRPGRRRRRSCAPPTRRRRRSRPGASTLRRSTWRSPPGRSAAAASSSSATARASGSGSATVDACTWPPRRAARARQLRPERLERVGCVHGRNLPGEVEPRGHGGRITPLGKFFRDRGPHVAAMIAYFALFSLVPLVFLALALFSVAGRADESSYLVRELRTSSRRARSADRRRGPRGAQERGDARGDRPGPAAVVVAVALLGARVGVQHRLRAAEPLVLPRQGAVRRRCSSAR